MRKITEIYNEYKIMDNLQLHQLRVAAVAMQFCDSLKIEIDKRSVIAACLIHDMGNIIKFKLGYFPEFLEPEGLEYWQNVQKEYIEKYGKDEHHANLVIAKELGVSDKIIKYINGVGFHFWCDTKDGNSLEEKICTYADTRISPHSVVTIKERLADGLKRYSDLEIDLDPERAKLRNCILDIEDEIFIHSKNKPEDITEDSISVYIEQLKEFLI
ncbi:MAG: HD domain-containing protein [Candidatus Nomurabacteria bacterium]|nr:HD domain-containing protein [Candidatus Nomurabacteria bacterium]